MFKDGSFFLTLVQSGTLLQIPRNISRSRWTWENWFMLFGIKISASSHIVLAGERLHNAETSSLHETPFLMTWTALVTSFIISSYGKKTLQNNKTCYF